MIMQEDNIATTSDLDRLIGYAVLDRNNRKIGKIDGIWEDAAGQPAFLSISTGWLGLGRRYYVPADAAEMNESGKAIRLPYDEDAIKNAPDFDSTSDIDEASETRINEYYRTRGVPASARGADWAATGETEAAPKSGEAEKEKMQLKEEELNVGKRTVESGGVRIRKVVRGETVNQPVELEHEEVEVEKVPASGDRPADAAFKEDEVFIPLRREVADVSKNAKVAEEVRVGKKSESERQNISETLRKEDVEVDKEKP
jgi:uncharacterized protein (TIGR02271 family)